MFSLLPIHRFGHFGSAAANATLKCGFHLCRHALALGSVLKEPSLPKNPAGMTLPNIITIGRLFLVPLVIVMIVNTRWQAAFIIFVLAGVSDAIDGFIAKRFNMTSELGAYLDPMADKALIVSIYITLAMVGAIPSWLAILVVSRDVMIVSAVLLSWVMARPVVIAPFVVSKLNTAAQLIFAALLLGSRAFGLDLGSAVDVGQLVVAVLTLGSMTAYLAFWLRHMAA
ncbi:CDP-diacylglycerol--glycerol-3-phosphate 3-phosphatidyltransferase [Bosea lathyri]|uniref:CDP-diacylglycerol--glycerol-3-phosphate 3-phosphatidyltransferase n=2 Tax=Bosea lathyri TaxID=1036778 RepID=A0A1H6CZ17_9HYPH|nr:CDP-diacylglycerol--glycerol-3-phosphate 3-phosphatidyltransferase [Bosea lathyri]